jgi:hypothetical protein
MHISAKKISEEVCPKIYVGEDPEPDRDRTFSKVGSGSGSATLKHKKKT